MEAGGEGQIINPAKLGSVEMEMICASCHVRGKDPTGQYSFPVGYSPGKNLADYYIPDKLKPGEPISEALIRLFRDWWGNTGTEEAQCEVCGIYGGAKKEEEPGKAKTMTDYCMGCHKYGDKYSRHTNHSATLKLQCFDCHKKVEVEVSEDETEDVHSVSYFLVHKKTCYDKNYSKACISCHTTWSEDKAIEWLKTFKGRENVHE
jgi:hypothetical protein